MKFGVLQFFAWPGKRVPLETIYARAFDRIETMDATGYDCVWLAEHHFGTYSVCPSIHMVGTHIAARTKRLRIGTAVSLAAFYHPLRLAEEVALLDVLSGGRVNWGAGRGFDPTEFRTFGVPREESYDRFRENFEIVLAAWTQEKLSYEGRFHSFEDVEVLPKPAQQPHPPVWLASSSPEAITWAAQQGHSILMDPHSPHEQLGQKYALFRRELAAHGHRVEGRDTPMARLLAVADSAEEAEQVARGGAGWMFQSYLKPSKGTAISDIRSLEARESHVGEGEGTGEALERYVRDVVIHGTPEMVLDQLARLREEISLEYLLCAPVGHRSFTLFTEKVLPQLL